VAVRAFRYVNRSPSQPSVISLTYRLDVSTIWFFLPADGTATNRWLGGVQAVSADTRVEPSWLDGQPCFTMQYAPNAPVFGNVRDEVRQISTDMWLGRRYDAATGHAKNRLVLRGK
jgi:hypothetical protein